jgi:hypothetical protein
MAAGCVIAVSCGGLKHQSRHQRMRPDPWLRSELRPASGHVTARPLHHPAQGHWCQKSPWRCWSCTEPRNRPLHRNPRHLPGRRFSWRGQPWVNRAAQTRPRWERCADTWNSPPSGGQSLSRGQITVNSRTLLICTDFIQSLPWLAAPALRPAAGPGPTTMPPPADIWPMSLILSGNNHADPRVNMSTCNARNSA